MLISKRLILRPIEEKDLKKIQVWKNDPEIKKTLGGFSFGFSYKDIIRWYKEGKKGGYKWSIVLKCNKKIIGFVGIYNLDLVNRNAEFGILIGDKKAHGKKYGTEVTQLVLDYCFYELNLNRVYLYVIATHVPAVKAYKNNGFKIEGNLRQHIYRGGKYLDYYVMGILKNEHKKRV